MYTENFGTPVVPIFDHTSNVINLPACIFVVQLPASEKVSVNPGAKCVNASGSVVPGTKTYLFCTYDG